jgi:hypothetical protein
MYILDALQFFVIVPEKTFTPAKRCAKYEEIALHSRERTSSLRGTQKEEDIP